MTTDMDPLEKLERSARNFTAEANAIARMVGEKERHIRRAALAFNTPLPDDARAVVEECRNREANNANAIGYAIGVMEGIRLTMGQHLEHHQVEGLQEAVRRLEALSQ